MENPWFGRRSVGYGPGPLTWQGWLAVAVGFGGGMACYRLLPHPLNDWAASGCLIAFLIAFFLTYDSDTEATDA